MSHTSTESSTSVVELTNEAGWRAVYPVMYELRPVDEETYVDYLRAMTAEGYRLFGLVEHDSNGEDGGEPTVADESGGVPSSEAFVAAAGVRMSTTLYHGKHAWVYDLVTRPDRRSEGHGQRLLSFVEEWAAARDCSVVELASGLWREDAHRFYEEHVDYERYCYTFKKDLA
jgi:GNAT superfamily N-acetyltransferase